jgi:hypothetical protein
MQTNRNKVSPFNIPDIVDVVFCLIVSESSFDIAILGQVPQMDKLSLLRR